MGRPRPFLLARLYCGVQRYLEAYRNPWYVGEFARIGWSANALPLLAFLQLASLLLYVIPQTAVLGAVLLTGYLGGAIATYVRMGEPYPVLVPLSTALIAWAGIYLREERLHRCSRSAGPFRGRDLKPGTTSVRGSYEKERGDGRQH